MAATAHPLAHWKASWPLLKQPSVISVVKKAVYSWQTSLSVLLVLLRCFCHFCQFSVTVRKSGIQQGDTCKTEGTAKLLFLV